MVRFNVDVDVDEERALQSFLDSLKDFDSNMLVIKELENEIKKRQGTFSEID
jgi:hypothetical protein